MPSGAGVQATCKWRLEEEHFLCEGSLGVWGSHGIEITLLRVIPTMAFQSDKCSAFFLASLLTFSGISSDILSGISSGILSGISSHILSGISFDILSDILSGISSAYLLTRG